MDEDPRVLEMFQQIYDACENEPECEDPLYEIDRCRDEKKNFAILHERAPEAIRSTILLMSYMIDNIKEVNNLYWVLCSFFWVPKDRKAFLDHLYPEDIDIDEKTS